MKKSGRPINDLSGQRFDMLTVIEATSERQGSEVVYLCQCDCGNTVKKSRASLKGCVSGGYRNHCGCLGIGRGRARTTGGIGSIRSKPKDHISETRSLAHLYWNVKYGAQKRGVPFGISLLYFETITRQNCRYCGASPTQSHSVGTNHAYIYNGIDRIDNTMGYTEDNTVACCGICNRMKSDMGIREFTEHIKQIVEHMEQLNSRK